MNAAAPAPATGAAFRTEWDRSRYRAPYLMAHYSEANVQRAVLQRLRSFGCFAVVVDSGAKLMRSKMAGIMARAGQAALAPVVMAAGAGAGATGFPDIPGVLPGGRALFVECKAPEWCEPGAKEGTLRQVRSPGRLSGEQLAFLQEAARMGAVVAVAWAPEDVDHLRELK